MQINKISVIQSVAALFMLIFFQIKFADTYQGDLYTSFFCFIFPFIFFNVFWIKFLREFFKSNTEEIEKSNIITMAAAGFLNGLACEFTAITTSMTLFGIMIYSIIKKNKKEIRLSLTGLIIHIISNCLYFTNPFFITELKSRNIIKSLDGYISYLNDIHIELFRGFKSLMLYDYSGYIIIIVLLAIIINYTKAKEISNKTNIIILCFIFGIIIFYIGLVFADRHSGGYLYIIHNDLIWQVKIALVSLIFFQLSFIDKRKYIIIMLIIISIIASIREFTFNKKSFNNIFFPYKNEMKKENFQNRYINERFYAYYAMKNSDYIHLYNNYKENDTRLSFSYAHEHYYAANYYGNGERKYNYDDIIFIQTIRKRIINI